MKGMQKKKHKILQLISICFGKKLVSLYANTWSLGEFDETILT
jgi:hypothetical protein